jgi:hypothetical protein
MGADIIVHVGHACLSAPLLVSSAPSSSSAQAAAQSTYAAAPALSSVYYVFPPTTVSPSTISAAATSVVDLLRSLPADACLALLPEPMLYQSLLVPLLDKVNMMLSITAGGAEAGTSVDSSRLRVPLLSSPHASLRLNTCNTAASDPSASTNICGFTFAPALDMNHVNLLNIGSREGRLRMLSMRFPNTPIHHFDVAQVEREHHTSTSTCDASSAVGADDPSRKYTTLVSAVSARRLLASSYMRVESIRNANIIGIVVGTMGITRHRDIVSGIQRAAKKAGKHTYTFMVGKLSAVKLGNFPEVDAFVLVACPENSVLDSTAIREYPKPLATPQEALIALEAGPEFTGSASFLFDEILSKLTIRVDDTGGVDSSSRVGGVEVNTGVSAADFDGTSPFSMAQMGVEASTGTDAGIIPNSAPEGGVVVDGREEKWDGEEVETALAVIPERSSTLSTAVFSSPAADYLANKRTWRGLAYEAPVDTNAHPASTSILQGLHGIAGSYTSEPKKM